MLAILVQRRRTPPWWKNASTRMSVSCTHWRCQSGVPISPQTFTFPHWRCSSKMFIWELLWYVNWINQPSRRSDLESRGFGNNLRISSPQVEIFRLSARDRTRDPTLATLDFTVKPIRLYGLPRVLIKNNKARLLFNGSFRPGVDYFSINDVTDMTDEWIISYGVAMSTYLAWIWNLRISYPGKPIFQYFDDVANVFRHIAFHPDIVGAHASRTPATDLLILALAAVFGKVDSPAEYIICADARAALAEFFQTLLGRTLLDVIYSFEKDIPWVPAASTTPFAVAEALLLQ